MTEPKFDETDRQAAIDKLSHHLRVRLARVGQGRKWLRDEAGHSYWVLGSSKAEWQGIPEEMMNAEVSNPSDGFIVIAIRQRSIMEIFVGPVAPLVAARAKLSRSKDNAAYLYTFTRRGADLFIDQVRRATLSYLTEFPFNETEKDSAKRLFDARKSFGELSEDRRREVLKKYQDEV